MLVFFIASMFSTVAGIILGLVPTIFLGIAMVSGYKLYAQKPDLNIAKSIKRFSYFDTCTKIFYKIIAIAAVVFGVGGALVSLILPFYDWWMDPYADVDSLFETLPLHISTTIGREFTLMEAHARPTSAKTTYITAVISLDMEVRIKPVTKQRVSRQMPNCIMRLRPNLEARLPMGI